LEVLRDAGIEFILGGGFAQAAFIGRWRDTKDIDFYLRPSDRKRASAALARAGFADYYRTLPYDRKWIYRSVKAGVIVDIIWSMANLRAQVDELWFARARQLIIRGQTLQVIPPEELMWCKLYVLQRDRCDWTDLFNLTYTRGREMDWEHLLRRLEDDVPLLKALLTLYGWLRPLDARKLPSDLWKRLGLSRLSPPSDNRWRNRVRLLDSRKWFAAPIPHGKKLEI
jgi:hypothetical protein